MEEYMPTRRNRTKGRRNRTQKRGGFKYFFGTNDNKTYEENYKNYHKIWKRLGYEWHADIRYPGYSKYITGHKPSKKPAGHMLVGEQEHKQRS
jgi:hypothetical protein